MRILGALAMMKARRVGKRGKGEKKKNENVSISAALSVSYTFYTDGRLL